MLVLTRKKDQKIIIGDSIEITVVEIGNGQVSLGISAPEDVEIYREEIYRKIEEENRQALTRTSLNIRKLGEMLDKKEHSGSEK